jgi:hypothetical protein
MGRGTHQNFNVKTLRINVYDCLGRPAPLIPNK